MPTTLEQNKVMTAQEMFNLAARHLLTQNAKSIATPSYITQCAYRGREGRMCAFGIFIPDDIYSPRMEGCVASTIYVWPKTCLPIGLKDLARDLQSTHDIYESKAWKARLRRVAELYDLNSDVLNEFLDSEHGE